MHDDINTIENDLIFQKKQINRLSNGTSNADVLDKLEETQHIIDAKLLSSQHDVSVAISEAKQNVSGNLRYVKNLVEDTSILLEKVQRNVTMQVTDASITIRNEVQGVRDNIAEYVAFSNQQFAAENDFVKYQLAGTFTLLGCLISGWHLTTHLKHYYKPDVQRRIMAVLWMVPVYGITSWLSLVFPSFESFFGGTRDIYEAYVIYTFLMLMVAILEDGQGFRSLIDKLTKHVIEEHEATAVAIANNEKPPVEHLKPPFPYCYVYHKPSSVATAWLFQCQLMGMQFVLLKPILSFLPYLLEKFGVDYNNIPLLIHNSPNFQSPKLYIMVVANVSVCIAFYGLLCFYHGTEKELAWCEPWPKFLCIKGVVFATFWQGATLQVMGSLGMVEVI